MSRISSLDSGRLVLEAREGSSWRLPGRDRRKTHKITPGKDHKHRSEGFVMGARCGQNPGRAQAHAWDWGPGPRTRAHDRSEEVYDDER